MGHREFVPSAIAPQSVHRIGDLDDGEVFFKRKSTIIRCACQVLSYFRVDAVVEITDFTIAELKGAFQQMLIPTCSQSSQQAHECCFAIVEAEVVDTFKYAWIADGSQFCIRITASGNHLDIGVVLPDPVSAFEGCIEITRKRDGKTHQIGLVRADSFFEQLQHQLDDKSGWGLQCLIQIVE